MDDVDAVQAQIARTMLETGDWVTARLDGVAYLEKAPLKYWLMALSFAVFGVHDWAARIPVGLAAIVLCWVTARFGAWAFSARAGFYAGLSLATCVGLFLFTRILIPDVLLTLAVTVALWAFLRALDEDEPRPRLWAALLAASLAAGVLLKGLIALVAPGGAGFLYLLLTRQLLRRRTWQRLRPFSGLLVFLVIAAPWHVAATLANPPYLDFTLRSEPGRYRGFFWFYFINEHLLRFLNLRHPRDYNTVPRLEFWLLNLVWLFPWSGMLAGVPRLGFRPVDRGGCARLLAACWAGFLLVFLSFSTTQEYYSMPVYPALALLVGAVMAAGGGAARFGVKLAGGVAALAAIVAMVLLVGVWNTPTPGDISTALTRNPEVYTLSLGHMHDLTLDSLAYLRLPLGVAAGAFMIGALGALALRPALALLASAVMMVILLHAARLALVVFDPYLSSRPLAEALARAPRGRLIVDNQYYVFSSVFFYTNRDALLLNGRVTNLEYGSHAPGAPRVFIDDAQLQALWSTEERYFLAAEDTALPRLEGLVGGERLRRIAWAGGKALYTNLD
ncbi:MAG: glycosyltransferase family 39 protein [Acidobacteria bacterium]|nr:glycosyltransferase family 39 protein [Acidobacteriota bacterium]